MHITAQGPHLRNDLYCVEWDVKLYYTIKSVQILADDTHIYGTCHPSAAAILREMSACVDDVATWIRSNRLQLNTAKTEVLRCATSRRRLRQIHGNHTRRQRFCPDCRRVRDLGIYLDSEDSMRLHVSRTVSSCFSVLRVAPVYSAIRHASGPTVARRVIGAVATRLYTATRPSLVYLVAS